MSTSAISVDSNVFFNGNNFIDWRVDIIDVLALANCKDAIVATGHPQTARALALIRRSVHDDLKHHVRDATDAYVAWTTLEKLGKEQSAARIESRMLA